jgi:mRNA-degrading endonuclease RelE of RelBE toxin-antitoxin system
MRWTIRYHRLAIQGIYGIERGEAAIVTEAIRKLADNPRPPDSEPVAERINVHTIEVAERTVSYEIIDEGRILLILWVG